MQLFIGSALKKEETVCSKLTLQKVKGTSGLGCCVFLVEMSDPCHNGVLVRCATGED